MKSTTNVTMLIVDLGQEHHDREKLQTRVRTIAFLGYLLLTGLPASGLMLPAAEVADERQRECKILADKRLEDPLGTIAREFTRQTQIVVNVSYQPANRLDSKGSKGKTRSHLVISLPTEKTGGIAVQEIPGATTVAWKYPSGEPVWAAVVGSENVAVGSDHNRLLKFLGGATAHRLWSESEAGFTITSGKSHAEAFDWVVENRVKNTYPLTAMRMLRECGDVRKGICIDIGCGTGNLDVELAKRSELTIIGLDIDPDMEPLFEKRIKAAKLEKRVSFVEGDAQNLPFEDDYADLIVSRGTLTFIPDIGKCLREVDRVLKPTGVAFLGGRYLYTPQMHKISNQKLSEIVAKSGIDGIKVIDVRGQWVKIIGSKSPAAAQKSGLGPDMLAARFVADYSLRSGDCLLLCGSDGPLQKMVQAGFLQSTDMEITALYSSEKQLQVAKERIKGAGLSDRITCRVGRVGELPFQKASFDAIVGTGPFLLRGDRGKGMVELHRVLRPGGVALVGGRFLGMPEKMKVPSKTLRASATKTAIPTIRVLDEFGQWVEISKAAPK